MKKLITLTFLSFATIIFTQEEKEKFKIEKNTWSIEGSFSINGSEIESYSYYYYDENNDYNQENFNFSISPKIGYLISENLTLGLGLTYGYSKSETQSSLYSESNSNLISVFPYVKKFIPVGKKLAFHLQGEASFSNSESTSKSYNIEEDLNTSMFFIGVRPGFSYSLSKNVLLQVDFGSLGYSTIKQKVNDVIYQESKSFGLSFNSSSLTFGFAILL